ncbi:host specificity protein J [Bordetella avium]|uniref:host specificity protein J n=1 Tax=Bordetella avium TaxID=521 RepID=UPI001F4E01AF|nr:host specificity protein J [Bordetella avium]
MKQRVRMKRKASSGAFFYGRRKASGLPITGHKGGKGGGGSRTPIEAPDSLRSIAYARVIDLLSEGEIYGPVHGPEYALRDVYFNGTPVQNEDGTLNFQNVQVDFRPGTQWQEPLPGFPGSENTVSVGTELKSAQAWVRQFTNRQLSAVRVTLAAEGLSKANTSNGDITGYRVVYAIDVSKDGAAYQQVLSSAFDGKTTQRYTRSHRIDLPTGATQGWSIRVRRLTPNANSSTVSDRTVVDAVTEVIDAKLRYPMSAVAGIKIDASQFQSIPTRAYDLKGRIIRVPSNYNPDARLYTGTWDGTFKLAWTDNPAWIFFDLVSNERYGLGARVPAGWLDKWGLYQIARYCDELVDDGFGGKEPRFTCNVYLQVAADATRVLQDLASTFRGMAYWANATVFAVADMPRDPVYTFSSANVVGGKFAYTGSALNTRYTVALVSWCDLSDMGRQKVEYVESREGIARYGIKQLEVTAFGCTSRGQANRVGKWLLLTSNLETRGVTFTTGLEHCQIQPGSIIRVADQHLAGRRIGGRIREATDTRIVVDAELGVRASDKLTVNLPSGKAETRRVSDATGEPLRLDSGRYSYDSTKLTADMIGLPGTVMHITVQEPFSEVPEPESVWTLESEELSAQTFRVLRVERKDGLLAEVSAIQHEAGKFANIDFGTRLDQAPISVVPPGVQAPPTALKISSYYILSQGVANHTAVFEWEAPTSAVSYEVQWRRDNSEWINLPRTGSTRVEVPGIYAGGFTFRVRALNALEVASIWATSALTELDGMVGVPPVVTSLIARGLLFSIQLDWGVPPGPSIIERTEIRYSQLPEFDSAIPLGVFAYPQNTHTLLGLSAGKELWFWARLVDKNGVGGEWYPKGNGVRGQASTDAAPILEQIGGKIEKTMLGQELQEEIDSGGGAATQIKEVQDGLNAMVSIKAGVTVDGLYYGAGMGVSVENTPEGMQTQVLFLADRFAFLNLANGTISTPFAIQGGQTFINDAFIGSLNAQKITAGEMSADRINSGSLTAKLANIDTAYINTGNIKVANIDRLRIAAGAVTGASTVVNTASASSTSTNYWSDVMTVPLGIVESTRGMLGIRLEHSKRAGGDSAVQYRVLLNGNQVALASASVYNTGVWYAVLGTADGRASMQLYELPAGSSLKVQMIVDSGPGLSDSAYTNVRLSVDAIVYYR